ncbi:metal ABC transporter ATP-binding protein [Pectinatus cerevisiiphilus]|uniref:Zinc transport system ATP-binding protein n=1 Tax=Pectinatus cerevisiiphilus TaxID=86956 RepID=A0A4R3K9R9_9FIRM|nr:metal ABC transporter ATP-binding protein [Pectinatus cerevisiiphilus]TCS79655.1 zinc transport system ATP-binding protein [Pectinatus cerevisiiphilus]
MLKIKHLYFSYSNKPELLKDINFSVNRGEYISIIGSNGSGKSTLVRLILGLLKPSSGTISNSFQNMAYVPQRFNQLNTHFPITVKEILNCYKNVRKKHIHKEIKDVLTLLHMPEEENTLIGQLSGGQCQKVFIARALLGDPDLLILDEPSNGIDRQSQIDIYNFLANLNKNEKMTVICVEHNLQAALKNSTSFYHIEKGKGHVCLPEKYIKEYIKSDLGENTENVYL